MEQKKSKTYRVSYKTYFNDRLKQVYFHGELTYPLYIQVTYDRKTIFFKSYYFELFSKSRYLLSVAGVTQGPSMEEIISKENEVIKYIIDRNPENFSLDLFKEGYSLYSKDLCDITEEGFINYLYTFLQDKGMPDLGVTIKEGSKFRIAYNIVSDMKKAFTPSLYKELMENALYYSPPYLPLYGFMLQTKRWPMLTLTVMEWETGETKDTFLRYAKKNYSDGYAIMDEVEKYLISLKEKGTYLK